MRMALTGQPISAEEAWISGLVSEVVADEEVQAHALQMAQLIAAMPPLAAEQIKEVILAGMDAPLEAGLALERKANALLFASRDQKEGMQAFIEKRPAKFEGY
ncbi:2,3-dehydroadipyl-CoA hydratase [compost metagenome]